MKLGQKPSKIWHEPSELKNSFSRFTGQINKLILLENVWARVTASKGKFWQLYAVKGSTIFVKVNVMAARHELLLKEKQLIEELNKSFDKPWIKKISIM